MTCINISIPSQSGLPIGGTWNLTVTRDQIIRQSMLDNGALGEAETPTSQEISDCAFKLNNLVKQWQGNQDFAPGLKMWTRQRASLFLGNTKHQYQLGPSGDNWAGGVTGGGVGQTHTTTTLTAAPAGAATSLSVASTSLINAGDYIGIQSGQDLFWTTVSTASGTTVTIPASPALPSGIVSGAYVYSYTTKAQRPVEIVTCLLRDSNSNDIPMNKMTLQDYEVLPSKVQTTFTSDPMAYYYESQLTNGQFYIDVGGAQDVTKHLHVVFLREISDFNNPRDVPEYPQQWYRALCWGLAKDTADMFDVEWTQNMESNFTNSLVMAKEGDAETTTFFFQPNAGDPFSP